MRIDWDKYKYDVMLSDNILIIYHVLSKFFILYDLEKNLVLYQDLTFPRCEPEDWMEATEGEAKKLKRMYHDYCVEVVKEKER